MEIESYSSQPIGKKFKEDKTQIFTGNESKDSLKPKTRFEIVKDKLYKSRKEKIKELNKLEGVDLPTNAFERVFKLRDYFAHPHLHLNSGEGKKDVIKGKHERIDDPRELKKLIDSENKIIDRLLREAFPGIKLVAFYNIHSQGTGSGKKPER